MKSRKIVKHIKRTATDSMDLSYCYVVLDDDVIDTKDGCRLVLYQALYGENKKFVRSYSEFYGTVNGHKRFTSVSGSLLVQCQAKAKTLI